MIKVRFESHIDKFIKDFDRYELKNRRKAARHVKNKIKRKALAMKKTGNLAKGVYMKNTKGGSYIGIRKPAHHAYLIEFGHLGPDGNHVPAHPIVYPTFAEEAQTVESIMSSQFV